MANLPRVTVIYSLNNLLQDISAVDGITAIIGTVDTVELVGVPNQVFNLVDAVSKGYSEADEPFIHRHIKEFYQGIAGNQELWIMGTDEATSMTQLLDHTNDDGAKKLLMAAEDKIRILGVCRKPDAGYDHGEAFIDADVETAVTAAKVFCEARLALLGPLRILIEGRVVNEESVEIYEPKTADIGYAGVVLGGTLNDGSASIGIALARAAKFGAEIKIGKVANGPLPVNEIYIGTKKLKELSALDTLHGKGYISFMRHAQKAGIYFGVDRMASTKDDRLLAYGRILDKATLITAAVYVNELENEIDIDPATGTISELDIEHLKGVIDQNINANMGDQISKNGVEIYIDPAQDIINTNTLKVKLRIIPKGYTSFIEVDLGLKAPTAA